MPASSLSCIPIVSDPFHHNEDSAARGANSDASHHQTNDLLLSPSSSTSADSSPENFLPLECLFLVQPVTLPPSSQKLQSSNSKPLDWRRQMVESAIRDIERAEFVAVDLEFSGLFRGNTYSRQHVLEKYFKECVDSSRDFMTVQIGICPVWRAANDPEYPAANGSTDTKSYGHDVWRMAPYNFHVFPSDRKVFSSDSSTLSWLLENGFSFDDWISNGFDFTRLAYLQRLGESKHLSWRRSLEKVKEEGLQRLIQTIIEEAKPVVMHNGLFDMLHIHHTFIDEAPGSLVDFCNEWLRIFIGGTYDTKHIANEGLHTILHIGNDRGTMLNELYATLHQKKCRSHVLLAPRFFSYKTDEIPELSQSFNCSNDTNNKLVEERSSSSLTITSTQDVAPSNVVTTRVPMTGTYSLTPFPTGHAGSKCHEAGYDAMLTAQVFLMELELFHRQSATKLIAKNESVINGTKSAGVSAKSHIPLNWRDSDCFGKRYTNVIELVKVAPGKIDLRGIVEVCRQPATRTWKRPMTLSDPPSTSSSSTAKSRLNGNQVPNLTVTKAQASLSSTLAAIRVDNDEASERPHKKRRTEEIVAPVDEDIEVTDERSSDVTARGRSSDFSSSDRDLTDDEQATKNEKEALLLRQVQNLREARRLKNKRIQDEEVANLDGRQQVTQVDSSIDSTIQIPQSLDPFHPGTRGGHYGAQSTYIAPSQHHQQLTIQRRIQLPQHRPTSTWAIPLLTNIHSSTSTIPSTYVPNGTHYTASQSTNQPSSRRYFSSPHLVPFPSLPYDSAIVSISNRIMNPTDGQHTHDLHE